MASALIRQVEARGGNAAVLARGDATAGALLLLLADRGTVVACRERGLRPNGDVGWIASGPPDATDAESLGAYIERRRRFDGDLWVVELDGIDLATIDAMLEAF